MHSIIWFILYICIDLFKVIRKELWECKSEWYLVSCVLHSTPLVFLPYYEAVVGLQAVCLPLLRPAVVVSEVCLDFDIFRICSSADLPGKKKWQASRAIVTNKKQGKRMEILLMEEIRNNHLACIKPCEEWEKKPTNFQPQRVIGPDFFLPSINSRSNVKVAKKKKKSFLSWEKVIPKLVQYCWWVPKSCTTKDDNYLPLFIGF